MPEPGGQAVQHRVQRVVFDLLAGRGRAAAPLQERVSRFCRMELDALLEAAFADAQPGRSGLRLEIDLGTIQAPVLERELASRLTERLRAALAALAVQEPAPELTPALAAHRADAVRWLLHGEQPAHGTAADTLAALAAMPQLLASLLAEHGRRADVRRRLAQLDDGLLGQAVYALEPAHARYIFACVDGIAHTPLPPPAPPAAGLRRALWEFVLAYLLVERGSHFNTLSFAASLLRQVAERFGIAYADLLELAAQQLEQAPFPARASLPGVIAELRHAVPAAPPAPAADDALADAEAYLEHGVLAVRSAWRGDAASLLERLLAERPDAFGALVRRVGRRAVVRQRLAVRMGAPFLGSLVALLAPGQARPVQRAAHRLVRLQAAHRIVPQDGAGFSRLLWRTMLDLLLGEAGSIFNRLSFLRASMRALASAHGMRYEAVLLATLARVPYAGRPRPGSLAALLLALSDEACLGSRSVDGAARGGAGVAALARRLGRAGERERASILEEAGRQAGLAPADAVQLAGALARAVGSARACEAQACLWGALRAGAGDRRTLLRAVLAAAGARTGLGYPALLAAAGRWLAGTVWSSHYAALLSEQEAAAKLPAAGQTVLRSVAGPSEPPSGSALIYLNNGVLAPDSDPAELVWRLLADPVKAAALLRAADPAPHAIRRLLATAGRAAVRGLLVVLAGANADPLLAYLEQDRLAGPDLIEDEAARWALVLVLLCDRHAPARPAAELIAEVQDRLARQPGVRPAVRADWAPLPLAPRRLAPGLPGLQAYLQFGAGTLHEADARFELAWTGDRAALAALLRGCVGREPERRRLAAMTADRQRRILQLLLGHDAGAEAWRCLELLAPAGWVRHELFAAMLAALAAAPGSRFDPLAVFESIERRTGRGPSAAQVREIVGRLRSTDGALYRRLEARLAAAARVLALRAPAAQRRSATVLRSDPAAALPENLGVAVAHAGVALLWPFLQHYFRALGLLDGARLRDGPARERAVHLVQYLATGGMDAPDEALVLHKLLCGLEPEEPVAPAAPASDDEAALSGQLLYSVTQTWPMLANTSIDGLRTTFLRRGGHLARHERGWTLHVDGGPFDMLLTSLPWRLELIRLPWMKALLNVEWKR